MAQPTNERGPTPAQHVRTFVDTHGRTQVAILAGGGAAAVGTVVPFAYVSNLFGGGVSYSIVQTGFYGVLLLAISIVLGIFPIFLKQYSRFTLIVYGASCALFGVFFALLLASFGVANMIGSSLNSFSFGFYLALFGYGAMVVGYYIVEQNREHTNAS